MNKRKSKGIVSSNITNFVFLIIAIVVLVAVLVFLFPGASSGVKSISLAIKKPFCCDLLGCKPATQGGGSSVSNPSGAIGCTAFCYGVCG